VTDGAKLWLDVVLNSKDVVGPGLSGPGRRLWARPGLFIRGVLAGVVLVFASQFLINRTTAADWLVSPLLLRDSNGTADVIVALGAGVTGNCVPNQNAVRRVLLAARLWRAIRKSGRLDRRD
jgi:uncharacterized SAM-binding protein YcdF (DUF218 family)